MPRVEAQYLPEHGDDPVVLSTPAEVDHLIDVLAAQPVERDLAALYSLDRPPLPAGVPDHELYVGVDGDRGVGALSFMDETGNWATVGSPDGRADVRYYLMCNETEFPPHSEIPLDLLRQAVKEFLASGGQRPTVVEWREHDV